MKKLAILLTVLALSGCCVQQFSTQNHRIPSIPTYEGTNHFILGGFAQSKQIDTEDVCGTKGIAGVETYVSGWNYLASVLTWGVYSPRGYAIYCKQD